MTADRASPLQPKRRLSPIWVILALLGVCVPTAGWWFGQERLLAHSLQSMGVDVESVPPIWPEKISDLWDLKSGWHSRPERIDLRETDSDSARATARWIKSFHYIGFSNLKLTRQDVRWIAGCRKLNCVNFWDCDLRAVDFSVLKANPSIAEVYVIDCILQEDSIQQLALLPGMQRLFLSNIRKSKLNLQGIAWCSKLRELQLDGEGVEAAELREIQKCPRLEIVELGESVVTDECLQILLGCPQLKELRIDLDDADSKIEERARAALPGVKVEGISFEGGICGTAFPF